MKLYKYLKENDAKDMVNNGTIKIGTLSYYRDIEDESRADRNEGKLEKFTEFKEGKNITNKIEFEEQLPFLNGSNISYIKGNIKIIPETKFISNEDVPDAYIYCTSQTFSEDLKLKFGNTCVEIFNVQMFLNIISDELIKRGLIYPMIASGRRVEYIGHSLGHEINISGNWIKDEKYKNESEFRFTFIPIYKKNGIIINPIINKDKSTTFPSDYDLIEIKPLTITCKEITKFCKIL